jgi:hypothetical protein
MARVAQSLARAATLKRHGMGTGVFGCRWHPASSISNLDRVGPACADRHNALSARNVIV